jgi:hypothetical protein
MGMQRGGEFLGQWVAHVYIPAGRRWTTDERDQPVARTGDLDVRAVTSLHIGIKIKGEVVVPDEWVVEEEPGDGTAGLSRQREAGAGEVVVCRESVPAPADESSAGDLPGWPPGEDAGDEVVVEPGEVVPSRHLKTDLAALRTQEHRFILGTGGTGTSMCLEDGSWGQEGSRRRWVAKAPEHHRAVTERPEPNQEPAAAKGTAIAAPTNQTFHYSNRTEALKNSSINNRRGDSLRSVEDLGLVIGCLFQFFLIFN